MIIARTYKTKITLRSPFGKTLLVAMGQKEQYRIYETVGGKTKVFKPLDRPFLTLQFAQEALDEYAKAHNLKPVEGIR